MSGLNENQLNQLYQQLLQEKNNLEEQLNSNDHFGLAESQKDTIGELSSYDNHPADLATETYERGKDIALNENVEYQLEDVVAALKNIENEQYGICNTCGKDIPYARLQAVPTTQHCVEHAKNKHTNHDRPIEEEFLDPPFGRTSLDEKEEQNQFDGEDAWQIVESWGTSNSPAMADEPEIHDYNHMYSESDERDGYVEPIESFLATNLYGNHTSVIRNSEYQKYMANGEGDHELEMNEN
ncbi:TraR/DksA C4-type zinc finger protein [Chengkuizengella axinellae]|uniref:TraR/DksA C4-type zinc finger protein n=1 Tax=Chengkuizengella axinellae TaxID=3064388 RepID=A0ABT9IUZ1_9BACL|nr:TraR/DksA C4-type zinc finger protein [Chengkuizengella sp. 2205SS18-9]MDP5273173.1 TraR/DksA C4-type zinc finger protein [Chengkuizengella sp. 2205SS18-9]